MCELAVPPQGIPCVPGMSPSVRPCSVAGSGRWEWGGCALQGRTLCLSLATAVPAEGLLFALKS